LEQAQAGDTVLIAGSNRELGLAADDRPTLCKDTELARRWLYESAQEPQLAFDRPVSQQQ
jgi:hypothetical protein